MIHQQYLNILFGILLLCLPAYGNVDLNVYYDYNIDIDLLTVIHFNNTQGNISTEMGAPVIDTSRFVVYFADYYNVYKISLETHKLVSVLALEIPYLNPVVGVLSSDNSTLLLGDGGENEGGIAKIDLNSFTLAANRTYSTLNNYWCAVADAATNTAIFFGDTYVVAIDFDTLEVVNSVASISLPLFDNFTVPIFSQWSDDGKSIIVGISSGGLLQVDPSSLKATIILNTGTFQQVSYPGFAFYDGPILYLGLNGLSNTSIIAIDAVKQNVIQPPISIDSSFFSPVFVVDPINSYLYAVRGDPLFENSTLVQYDLGCEIDTPITPCVTLLNYYNMSLVAEQILQDVALDFVLNYAYIPLESQFGDTWVQTSVAIVDLN